MELCLTRVVRRVQVAREWHEVVLDAPDRHEAPEDAHAARLVVRAARARAAKRLLPDDRARALLVVVDISSSVSENTTRMRKGDTVLSESTPRKHVRSTGTT